MPRLKEKSATRTHDSEIFFAGREIQPRAPGKTHFAGGMATFIAR